MLTWIRLVALTLTALTLGLSFAHVLSRCRQRSPIRPNST
jgi:hypothetical protein